MANSDLTLVRTFERELDISLHALPTISRGGEGAISLAAKVIEACYSQKHFGIAHFLKMGLEVLAPYLVHHRNSTEPNVSELMHDLEFAGHYYILRDYLYYTYNAPGSLDWRFSDLKVDIGFRDCSIPRQFYLQANNMFITSIERFADDTAGDQIVAELQSQHPVKGQPIDDTVLQAIEAEIDTKLSTYFNFLSGEPIDLGGCLFTEFERVFRVLLVHALFHRYHARALSLGGPVYYERSDLLDNLVTATGLDRSKCERVLDGIVYSKRMAEARIQPMYFSLYELGDAGSLVMIPDDFATWEGYIDILRIAALRNPSLYMRNVSDVLSRRFVNSVTEMFSAQGFLCATEVKLSNFASALPDIDLLVISEEAPLGYVVFVCELKAPIPPQWAKDHLRVLNQDSVAKAFHQLEKLSDFFASPQGHGFLASLLPKGGLPHFGGEFLVVYKFLIITSRNAGMFFSDQTHTIIDYQTLERALKKCDGDVAYLLHVLAHLDSWLDQGRKTGTREVAVGRRSVKYEVTEIEHLIDFSANVYKSAGVHQQMLEQCLQEGGRPLDVLKNRKGGKSDESKD